MKIQKTILRETGLIALGLTLCGVIEIAVFVLLGKYDLSVLLGTLVGTVFSLLNFFLMGLSVQKAMNTDTDQVKLFKRSYTLRMLLLIAVLTAAYFLPFLHLIAACVPFLVVKPVIYIVKRIESKKTDKESAGDEPA